MVVLTDTQMGKGAKCQKEFIGMMRNLVVFLIGCCVLLPLAPANEKPKFENTKDEITVADLTNQERKKDGKTALTLNPALSKIARAHSENMAKQGKMEHKLDKKDVFNRLDDAKFDYQVAGENIAFGPEGITMKTIMKLWMDSETHRKNILYKDFTEIGIGIARAKNGDLYFTQVFAKPAK
jgi:uncharacterized protein YkwD